MSEMHGMGGETSVSTVIILGCDDDRAGFAIARVGTGGLGTLLLGLWLDSPLGGFFASEIDRLSIINAMLAVVVFPAGFWLMCVDPLIVPTDHRSGCGAGGALAAFSVWLTIYPEVALGPYAIIPAKDRGCFSGTGSQPSLFADLPKVSCGWDPPFGP